MFFRFNLYDLFLLSFVEIVLMTLFILSPARKIGTRFQWTGSRFTEVILGSAGAGAFAALSCFVTASVWGIGLPGVETAAFILWIFSVIVISVRADCNVVGQLFYASFASAGIVFVAFAALVASVAIHSVAEAVTSVILIIIDLGALVVWTSNINYVSDVLCRSRHSRPGPVADSGYMPMVSIHIPAYNEPPDLLIETIKSVEHLDYPNFEIVVIDNNTKDAEVYRPVEEYCRGRDRIKFVHVDPWPGFKAGACNLALRSFTDPRAEIIGIVDADDIVKPYYLRETVGYFVDPHLGFLQTFEGNRDFEGSAYYTACVDSYQAFYLAVMSSRNERDSVPFVGTMGLIRRNALEGIGGWNEWCIGEDTEASLRVLKAGWSGLYVPRCFGRGVVPPSFAGLNTQRYRWCFGGMQIFRLHWRSLMPWDHAPDNHLTAAQRRDYLMACFGWLRDLLMVFFTAVLLATAGLLLSGSNFDLSPLAGARSLLPMSLILVSTVCMMWTLRHWTTISRRRVVLGLAISLSACWITALACIQGLTRKEGVFLRTQKTGASGHGIRTALRLSRWELVLSAALYVSAGLLADWSHPPILLIAFLALQGTVYACAPFASLWNLWAQRVPSARVRQRFARQPTRRPALIAVGLATSMFLAIVVGVATAVFAAPVRHVGRPASSEIASARHAAIGASNWRFGSASCRAPRR